jgi:hypothetical protein
MRYGRPIRWRPHCVKLSDGTIGIYCNYLQVKIMWPTLRAGFPSTRYLGRFGRQRFTVELQYANISLRQLPKLDLTFAVT